MVIWRLLEITLLNKFFTQLNNDSVNDRTDSYIPLNQQFFQENMISGVKAILISLSQIFDSLDIGNDKNKTEDI